MENLFENTMLLDQFQVPAFMANDGRICQVNLAAQQHLIRPDTPVEQLLGDHADTYHNFHSGCLCMPLQIHGIPMDFCIYRANGTDFAIAQPDSSDDLRAMALVAGTMRTHLANISALTDMLRAEDNPLAAEFNREVHRLSRLASNMSDANGFNTGNQYIADLAAVLAEVFEQAATLTSEIGIQLHYQGIRKPINGYVDPPLLRRAILNLISNSAKFTPAGGQIHAVLSQHGKYLHLTLWDTGEGIDPKLLPTVFSRYRRQSAVEDSRYGLGLGLLTVCNAARAHGGTLLIESTATQGSRVTLTLAVKSASANALATPLLVPDYTSGRDPALQELSDVLPARLYE